MGTDREAAGDALRQRLLAFIEWVETIGDPGSYTCANVVVLMREAAVKIARLDGEAQRYAEKIANQQDEIYRMREAAACLSPQPSVGWQPIKTLKYGEKVLLYRRGHVYSGRVFGSDDKKYGPSHWMAIPPLGDPDPVSSETSREARKELKDMVLSLHRCKTCGTAWLLWPDAVYGGGWNLLDKYQRPGACCDNAAMGEQIEHLRNIPLTVSEGESAPRAPSETPEATTVEIIVNGQPVTVAAGPIRRVIAAAIEQAGQIGRPLDQWVLRTYDGEIIPHALPGGEEYAVVGGQQLFLHLGLPPAERATGGETPPPQKHALPPGRWTATYNTKFGAAIWYGGKLIFRVESDAETARVSEADPVPLWQKCVEAVIAKMNEPVVEGAAIRQLIAKWRETSEAEWSAWRSGADEKYRWRSSTLAQCATELEALLSSSPTTGDTV